ncbi:MAG: hypothetical protein K0U64_01955 [Actinomycetia bacterium]|nr:hypothetical protein [Actinomycetes bacterium]
MAILIYTGLRLLLLFAVLGLFFALGMRGILLLVAGFAVSAVLSYFLLTGPRAALATKMSGFFGGINAKIDAATTAEDDAATPEAKPSSTTTAADVDLREDSGTKSDTAEK